MRKATLSFLLLLLVSLAAVSKSRAQSTALPPFKMMLSNGRMFSADELPQGKPVVLIYFSPDCDHCQKLMNAFFKNINQFQNAEVVLVTFKPVEEVARFEQGYQTTKYPNIKVGTEGTTFYLRSFYRMDRTPFTALYDKGGKLVYAYRTDTPVDDLINRLKKIN